MSDDDWDRSISIQDYVALAYSYVSLMSMVSIVTIFVRKLRAHRTAHNVDGHVDVPQTAERNDDDQFNEPQTAERNDDDEFNEPQTAERNDDDEFNEPQTAERNDDDQFNEPQTAERNEGDQFNEPQTAERNNDDQFNEPQTVANSQTQSVDTLKSITRASIAAIMLYLLFTILLAVLLTKWILIDNEHGVYINFVLLGASGIPYMINMFGLIPFILLQRLHHIYPKKWIRIVSYTVPPVLFLVVSVPSFAVSIGLPSLAPVFSTLSAIFTLLVLIIYIVIVIVYFKKIPKAMGDSLVTHMNLRYMEMPEVAVNTQEIPQRAVEHSDEIIANFQTMEDTVRCALLVMFCSVSNFLGPILGIIGATMLRHETHHNTMSLIGVLTDSMVNAACLCLLFRFMKSYYDSICVSCDKCLLMCCVDKVVHKYRKTDQRLTHEQYTELILSC